MRAIGKSEDAIRKADIRMNEGMLEWPGGATDWYAFAVYNLILFLPLFILDLRLLHFNLSKIEFLVIFGCFGAINAYFIYWRHNKWLKTRIDKKAKQFYFNADKR